jgi:hypothetical protein
MVCSYLYSHVLVARHGVWIGKWIYWTLRFAWRFFCFGAHALNGWQLVRNPLTSSHQVKFMLWRTVLVSSPSGAQDQIFVTVRQLRVSLCGPPMLTRGRVRHLQLLLVLARAVILRSESCGTHGHILLSDSRLPKPGGPDHRIYILQEQGSPVIPQALGPFLSPPTNRRATVEVLEPVSTRALVLYM